MERISSMMEINGDMPEEERALELSEFAEKFDNQEFYKAERQKNPEELRLISEINTITNRLLQRYGGKEFNIPAQNIHIINNRNYWNKHFGSSSSGTFCREIQGIFIPDAILDYENANEASLAIVMAERVIHENIHMKFFNSMQKSTSNDSIIYFQCGIDKGDDDLFTSLNEGITQLLTDMVMKELINTNIFSKEEIGAFEAGWGRSSYPIEKCMIRNLCKNIYEKNTNVFKNKDEVFDYFIKAMLDGNRDNIIKIIDDNFGNETFKKFKLKDIVEQSDFFRKLNKEN